MDSIMPRVNYEDPTERPLFGENTRRERFLNLIVGAFTALIVAITMIFAFVFHGDSKTNSVSGLNIYFASCITLICGSHLVVIYWYRMGDLEPKFRNLIYFNAFTIILLCICANLYFQGIR